MSGSRARRDQRRASSRTGIRGGRHRAGCTAGRCRGVDLSGRRCTGCAVGPADRRRPAGRGLAGSVGIGRNRPPGSALRDRGGHRCRTGRAADVLERLRERLADCWRNGRRPGCESPTGDPPNGDGGWPARLRCWPAPMVRPHRGQHPDRAVRRRRHRGGLGRVGNRRHRRGGCRLPGRGHSSGRPYDGGVRGTCPRARSGPRLRLRWRGPLARFPRRRDLRSRVRVGSRLAGLSSPGRLADRRTGGPGLGSSGHVHLGPRWCCA